MQELGREVSFVVAYLSCRASVYLSPTVDRSSLSNEEIWTCPSLATKRGVLEDKVLSTRRLWTLL